MHAFWAMSNFDKLILSLKILVVGFGWASIIFAWVLLMFLISDWFVDRWREKRRNNPKPGKLPTSNDPQLDLFQLKQVRRERQQERDEFFKNVQEIQNDLR